MIFLLTKGNLYAIMETKREVGKPEKRLENQNADKREDYKMKKIIMILLSFVLLFSAVSCMPQPNVDHSDPTDTVEETTEEITEKTIADSEETTNELEDATNDASCAHELGAWSVLTPATEREDGAEIRKCTHCDHFQTRILHAIGTEGLLFTLSEDERSYSVSAGTATAGDVFIPAYHNGLPVTTIGSIGLFDSDFDQENTAHGSYAFYQCSELKSVVIPSTVTVIGDAAFAGCMDLKTMILPPAVAEIGDGAFMQCEKLESIVLSEALTTIGDMAFMLCKSLKSVVIPAGIEKIGEYAFALTETENPLSYYHSDIKILLPNTQVILILREFSSFFSWGVEIYYLDENGTEVLIKNITFDNSSMSPFLNGDFEIVNNNDNTFTVRAGDSENIGKWIDQTFDIPQCVSVFIPKTEDTVAVFYGGNNRDAWDKTDIAVGNTRLVKDNVTIKVSVVYYYSETQPTVPGDYWHYVDGVPVVWES